MVDGVLDLLAMILVLGLVVAVAFGFVLPLMSDDVLEYNSQYEDKAMLGVYETYEDPEAYEDMTRHYYTYEELMLLLAVQDNRMEEPKTVSLRNLVTVHDFYEDDYKYGTHNINDINMKNLNKLTEDEVKDEVLSTIRLYTDNHASFISNALEIPPNVINRGLLTFAPSYGVTFNSSYNSLDEMARKDIEDMINSLSQKNSANSKRLFRDDLNYNSEIEVKKNRKYFIELQFAISSDNEYIKNSSYIMKDLFEKDLYVIHREDKNMGIDSYQNYQNFLKKIRDNTYA